MLQFKDCYINRGKLLLPKSTGSTDQLPTMYQSWTAPQKRHLKIRSTKFHSKANNGDQRDLLIFDTWGTSSYYHLLIDHIIPVWITKNWAAEHLGILQNDPHYWRISNNGWKRELPNAREIFSYFLGVKFEEEVEGHFSNVLYGYCYSWRLFHGGDPVINENYKSALQEFRSVFCPSNDEGRRNLKDKYVLVPTRKEREFEYVKYFVSKYCDSINFQIVDMGQLTIKEQIDMASGASAIFGSEGAAFANSIFMENGSLFIPFSREPERFLWHQTISSYVEHDFYPVFLDSFGHPLISEEAILQKLMGSSS